MHFKMFSAICFNLDQSRILSSVNGLTQNPAFIDPFMEKKAFEKIVGKAAFFFLFPLFSNPSKTNSIIKATSQSSSAHTLILA